MHFHGASSSWHDIWGHFWGKFCDWKVGHIPGKPHPGKHPPKCPVPCFTPGTRIVTERGERRVEKLSVGDRVATRDNGLQPIRWIGQVTLTPDDLEQDPSLRPVRIRAGAMGAGVPTRDMLVSPQHRLLLRERDLGLLFDGNEMLVPAVRLLAAPGFQRRNVSAVTYIHLMFDHHELILSDGVWTESFQPGADVLSAMDEAQRGELLRLFPALSGPAPERVYPAARSTVKAFETRAIRMVG